MKSVIPSDASTLHEALLLNAQMYRDEICFEMVLQDQLISLTYGDLTEKAKQMAALFLKEGMQAGDVLLIGLHHSPDLVASFWGAMLAGIIPSIIAPLANRQNPTVYAQSIRHLVKVVDPCRVLLEEVDRHRFLDLSDLSNTQLLTVQHGETGVLPPAQTGPEDLAFLQFSSGTTGHRKGVTFTHRRVLNHVKALAESLVLDSDCRIASWLPLYHDMGLVACFLLPIVAGIPLVLLDPFEWVSNPSSLFVHIQRQRSTHVWMPNFAFNHLVQTVRPELQFDLRSMRAWVNCSEPCKASTFEQFLKRFSSMGVAPNQLQTSYAMAEAVFAVTNTAPGQSALDHTKQGVMSAGSPLPGMTLRIQDGEGNPLPNGAVGNIALRGDSIFDGYFHNPEATSVAILEGWFLTGDLGCLEGGELFVVGRSKDVIIIHGINLFAHDLESSIAGLPGTKPGRILALGLENEFTGSEELVILIEAEKGAIKAELKKAAKKAISDEFGVSVARVVGVPTGWLAKTTSGKLDRRSNRERYLETTHG